MEGKDATPPPASPPDATFVSIAGQVPPPSFPGTLAVLPQVGASAPSPPPSPTPLFVLLGASFTLLFSAIDQISDWDNATFNGHRCGSLAANAAPAVHDQYKTVCGQRALNYYTIAAGAVSAFFVGLYILVGLFVVQRTALTKRRFGLPTSPPLDFNLERLVATLFAFWWGVSSPCITFAGPFLTISNGFIAAWCGLIAAVIFLVSVFEVWPAVTHRPSHRPSTQTVAQTVAQTSSQTVAHRPSRQTVKTDRHTDRCSHRQHRPSHRPLLARPDTPRAVQRGDAAHVTPQGARHGLRCEADHLPLDLLHVALECAARVSRMNRVSRCHVFDLCTPAPSHTVTPRPSPQSPPSRASSSSRASRPTR